MPPRLPASALRHACTQETPILSFLYPIASRRLLSTSFPLREDSESQKLGKLMDIAKTIPRQTSELPPISPRAAPSLNLSQQGHTDFAGSVNRERQAFRDLNKLNRGVHQIINQMNDNEELKKEMEESMGEKIDPELYRYSAPVIINSYISPKDMRFEEYQKYLKNRRYRTREDFFEKTKENPMHHYKNFNLLKDFMTSAGRIKHRSLTGLSNTNQRKLSKAIRRAIGIGLMPSVYRHPELLKKEQNENLTSGPKGSPSYGRSF